MHKGPQWCQPDALSIDILNGQITIFEVKLRHCEKAYKQLVHLYSPVVQKVFPEFEITTVEICAWFDREVRLPRKHTLLANLKYARQADYSVHIWRKKNETDD